MRSYLDAQAVRIYNFNRSLTQLFTIRGDENLGKLYTAFYGGLRANAIVRYMYGKCMYNVNKIRIAFFRLARYHHIYIIYLIFYK